MELKRTTAWSDEFFSEWVLLHEELYAPEAVLEEKLADLKDLLGDPRDFPHDRWIALSATQGGVVRARALVAVSDLHPDIAKVGFIECVNDEASFKFLWEGVEASARELGATHLKGPINLHFFVSYRWKTDGEKSPFYSEPQQKAYYLRFFEMVGMKPLKTWKTFRIRFFRSKRQYGEIRQAKNPEHRLRIRGIDMQRFDQEMEVIHRLFVESFKEMSEYEPMPLATFKKIYAGFRTIISPRYAFIIEHEGLPVAFCINFMDPLPALLKRQRWLSRIPQRLLDMWTWCALKLNHSRLLIMYVGRLPAPDGKEFKGIQSLVAKKMTLPVALTFPQLYICFTAEDSPALKSYQEDQKEHVSSYALFGKSIQD